MLFYLTNSALDISSGILWWITKQTCYGVYSGGKYIIYGSTKEDTKTKDINLQIKELQNQIINLHKSLEIHNKNKVKYIEG